MESCDACNVLEKFGGLDSLVYRDIPEPEPKVGYVVIQIEAFGINHAEMHMRRGEWAEAAPVIGIECVVMPAPAHWVRQSGAVCSAGAGSLCRRCDAALAGAATRPGAGVVR